MSKILQLIYQSNKMDMVVKLLFVKIFNFRNLNSSHLTMKNPESFPMHNAVMLALILAFSISCTQNGGSVSGLAADSLEAADAKMMAYVDQGKLPCVATMVLKDGEVVHRLTYGQANIEEERMLTDDAIFRIYSMSKPVTAAALMMLYDEGKFQLDDPVAMYIPEFQHTKVYEDGEEVEQIEPFTVRHLLTHTAGFSYGMGKGHVDSLYNTLGNNGIWNGHIIGEVMKLVAEVPLKHQPGTTYEYSISIDVAGYLIEVLSGMTFDVFLQTRLFDPLGMEDTGFQVPEEDFDRLAMIYTPNPMTGELAPVPTMTNDVKENVTLFSGGVGLVSTLSDYMKFGEMLLNGGELNGTRILQESTVRLIMSDQMPEAVEYDGGYGLGGYVNLETGAYGLSGAASTDFVADPSNNMVILCFTQYIPFMGVPFADEYKEMVWNALQE
jgi:CubicO group peptidase (beta-lactamase class C family)